MSNLPEHHKFLPKRIILVRHGESAGNLDGAAYTHTPDYKIPLTPEGIKQAKLAGSRIRDVISDSGKLRNWKVCLYVSPYERTRSTLRGIGSSFPRKRVIAVREECRIREQDFGNFQITERMKVIKETRERFGRFFYRFPEGESAADVFDRVSSFLESLWRDIDSRLHYDPSDDLNIILVSHGLTSRVFLMKWFKWTVEQFEYLNNFNNCEFRVMQLGDGGEYSLAVHHSDQQMQEWGLTAEMIADQKCRANAKRGATIEKCPWYMDHFIDHFESDSDEDRNKTTTVSGNPLTKKCWCGCDAILQTSWTSSNPGRRFYCCSRKVRNCGFIDWFDPTLCERAKMIIPGLLKSKNKLGEENHRLKLLLCLTWLAIGIFFFFSLRNKSAN